jgi:serine/threonine-protein kinase
MLTGLPPWPGEAPQLVLRALTTGPMPAPASSKRGDVDADLDAILVRALARNPEDRFPSADRLQHELGLWLAERSKVVGPRHLALLMQDLHFKNIHIKFR